MKNPDLMKLRSDCSLMELRGRYLLIRPGGKTLQINESFAWLWNVAPNMNPPPKKRRSKSGRRWNSGASWT